LLGEKLPVSGRGKTQPDHYLVKIAYLGQMADVATENSISKKIRSQTATWQQLGHTVKYFTLAPTTNVWSGLAGAEPFLLLKRSPWEWAANSLRLCRHLRRWKPDLVYFRYANHAPGLPGLFRSIPTIAEINSDDTTEYVLTLPRYKVLYHILTRDRIFRSIRALLPVTSELASRLAHFAKPTLTIGNSINLADFPLQTNSPDQNIRLVFIGSRGAPWHGLDRLAELAGLLPSIAFDVVGYTPEEWRSENLPAGGNRLCLHGPLPRTSYESLLSQATAAIGTLGLYRKHMEEACPLKVREYLALGLPVIGAYQDTDIPPDADYFLRLPNNAEPLAPWRDRILAFLDHWRSRRVPRPAIAHLDVSVKEARRLAFMEQILGASHHV
jgi:glycosyltransferase involved in cell wall biosynthesis